MTFRRFSNGVTLALGLVLVGLIFTYWGDPPQADASRYIDHRPIRPSRSLSTKAIPLKSNPSEAMQRININKASMEELMTLKGIGESKAKRILAFRKKHGSFKRIKDLRRVKGIGRKTVLKLRPFLALKSPLPNKEPAKAQVNSKKSNKH